MRLHPVDVLALTLMTYVLRLTLLHYVRSDSTLLTCFDWPPCDVLCAPTDPVDTPQHHPVDVLRGTTDPVDMLRATTDPFEVLNATTDPVEVLSATTDPVDYVLRLTLLTTCYD